MTFSELCVCVYYLEIQLNWIPKAKDSASDWHLIPKEQQDCYMVVRAAKCYPCSNYKAPYNQMRVSLTRSNSFM